MQSNKYSYILTIVSLTIILLVKGVSILETDTEKEIDNSKEFAQLFDKIFNTDTIHKLDFEKMKLLHKVYEYFEEDMCKNCPSYRELSEQHIDIVDMLEKTHSKAQTTLFNEHLEIGSQMVSIECEQMFYFGFILAKTLDTETKIDISVNK